MSLRPQLVDVTGFDRAEYNELQRLREKATDAVVAAHNRRADRAQVRESVNERQPSDG